MSEPTPTAPPGRTDDMEQDWKRLEDMIAYLHTYRCYAPTEYELGRCDDAAALAYEARDRLLAAYRAVCAERQAMADALADLTDGQDCEFRGNYCMVHHAKTAGPGTCPNDVARRLLAAAVSPPTPGAKPQEGQG